MSENAGQSPPPQTTNVFVDRPCLKCGYNLRGQMATWNRRALNWQVICPECGGTQVVVLGSTERNLGGNPFFALALVVIVGWLVWQLVNWMAASCASMMQPPPGAYDPLSLRSVLRSSGSTNYALPAATALDAPWFLQLSHFAVHAMPIAMAAMGLGIVVSSSPYSTERQRKNLLLILVMTACVLGFYFRVSGDDMPFFFDWKWKMASGMVGLIAALVGGRFGLAIGRPLLAMVAGMYVKAKE